MKTVNRGYLVKCNDYSQVTKVFKLLDSLQEPTNIDEFGYTEDWHYVGYYNYYSKWTIAKPGSGFGSDVISFDDFIEKYKPIDMEEIQKKCIKRFPIGCKFTIPGSTYVKTLKEDEVTYEISGNDIYAHDGAGCLYSNGEYAILVSLPEEETIKQKFIVGKWYKCNGADSYLKFKSEEEFWWFSESIEDGVYKKENDWANANNTYYLIDVLEIQQYLPDGHPDKTTSIPEYVECINALMFAKRGKIYPVVSDTSCMCEDGNTYSWKGSEFQPSTKEAYNAQFTKQEPIYAYVGDPLPTTKPLIDNVQSISVNLRTKKKTNKLKF